MIGVIAVLVVLPLATCWAVSVAYRRYAKAPAVPAVTPLNPAGGTFVDIGVHPHCHAGKSTP